MSALLTLLSRARLILSVAALLALAGAVSWVAMPRQEDPQLPYRGAIAIASFPGANAETMERLVVEPVEERLAEVEEISKVYTTIRTGVAVFDLELLDEVYDVEEVWDEVRRKLNLAAVDFPEGVAPPTLNDETFDVDSIVVAVKGSSDPLVLAEAAEKLKKALLRHPLVAKVNLIGDPQEQVTIELEDATARRLGIDAGYLASSLEARNLVLPGGQLRIGDRSAVLDPRTDFGSM